MSKRRVVVTGLGVVTSLGESVDQVWDALCAGKSGIVPIRRWDCSSYPTRFGGECYDFDLTKYKGRLRAASPQRRRRDPPDRTPRPLRPIRHRRIHFRRQRCQP